MTKGGFYLKIPLVLILLFGVWITIFMFGTGAVSGLENHYKY
jgi:hypothetical protein